jgi:glycerate-2-kinase
VNADEEIIFVVEEAAEGGFTARALGHGIVTEADDPAKLRASVREAVERRFEPERRPRVIRLHIVRDEVFQA